MIFRHHSNYLIFSFQYPINPKKVYKVRTQCTHPSTPLILFFNDAECVFIFKK
jgi:hypothetical protein